MSHTSKPPRAMRRKNAIMIALGVCMLAYLAAALTRPWLGAAAFYVSGVLALGLVVLSFLWIAALDEVARRAHFEAWYWGGSIGLGVSAFIMVALFAGTRHLGGLPAEFDFSTGVALGFLIALMPAVIGYGVWWTVFWLRRR